VVREVRHGRHNWDVNVSYERQVYSSVAHCCRRSWHILQTELALHEFTFTARAASTYRRSRSRLTRSSMDMAVLIDGWLDSLSDKRCCLYFLRAFRRVWADIVKFWIFHDLFLICHQQIFDKVHFLWLKSTDLDEIFSLAPKSAR